MRTIGIALALAMAGLGAGAAGAQLPTVPPVAPAVETRMADVLPAPEEDRWLQVPWKTNLAEAFAEARRTGKPVLLWVMNGNPLGCA